MIQELLPVGLLVVLSVLAVVGTVVLWRRWGRRSRVAAMVGMLASYCAVSLWIVDRAQQGGWPNGMFAVLAGFALVPATTLAVAILAVYSAFLGKVAGETLTPSARHRRWVGAQLEAFLELAPGRPEAAVALAVLDAIERLHGI